MPSYATLWRKGLFCVPVFDELNGIDEANMADFADVLVTAQGFHQSVVEIDAFLSGPFHEMIPVQYGNDGIGNGTAQGIPCIGMTVDEGLVATIVIVKARYTSSVVIVRDMGM